MRSASMPLFGFPETRISLSLFALTPRFYSPLVDAGEETCFFVLFWLGYFSLFRFVRLLLAWLLFVFARAHLGRLRSAADVAVLARVLEQCALEHFAAAIQTRHHGADRTVENLGDLFVREAFDIGEKNDHLVVVRKRVERTLDV